MAHVARSGSLRTDVIIWNWSGLYWLISSLGFDTLLDFLPVSIMYNLGIYRDSSELITLQVFFFSPQKAYFSRMNNLIIIHIFDEE